MSGYRPHTQENHLGVSLGLAWATSFQDSFEAEPADDVETLSFKANDRPLAPYKNPFLLFRPYVENTLLEAEEIEPIVATFDYAGFRALMLMSDGSQIPADKYKDCYEAN